MHNMDREHIPPKSIERFMVSSLPLFLIIYDKNKMKLSLLKCLRKWRTTIICGSEIGNLKQEPKKASALAGYSYKGYYSV